MTVNSSSSKLFVLDTNVLMHDPSSLFKFEEHDIYIPLIVLEELDNNKKGLTDVARNARQASRSIEEIINSSEGLIQDGFTIYSGEQSLGKLFLQTESQASSIKGLTADKPDNQILEVAYSLKTEHENREVILVSKDINIRIKARALSIVSQDYFSDRALEDSDLLPSGVVTLGSDFWEKHAESLKSWQENSRIYYSVQGPISESIKVNDFVAYTHDVNKPFYAKVTANDHNTVVLEVVKDFSDPKNSVWGITSKNKEQNFALNLLMDTSVDFVTLLGQAGTGKTLLTLAAALSQVLDSKIYSEIIFTRATVPVGEDIGFLPGTEEEKMAPWMGALFDNLEVLINHDKSSGDWGKATTNELIMQFIKVKSMSFMRGRTFLNKFLIIDEAQNLTPKQMKTLVTRAGPGTKVVCLGNLAQIDTPYLTEGSSGLTFVVDRFRGWEHSGHITLAKGERSRLADYAANVL